MPIQSWGKSDILAYFGLKIGHFGHIFEDIASNSFCPIFPLISRDKPSWKSIGLKFTSLAAKKTQKCPYYISKPHFAQQVSITKMPTTTFFHGFV